MKFKNTGEDVKIRLPDENGFFWKTAKAGEEIDLPEDIGIANKLEKVEEQVDKPVEDPKKSKKSKKD